MSRRDESIWPLLCILACLFVLSAVTPPSWESVARSEPADEYLSRISASPMRSVVGIAAHRPAKAAAGAALAKIPPAVQNPESALTKQPVEMPTSKLSVLPGRRSWPTTGPCPTRISPPLRAGRRAGRVGPADSVAAGGRRPPRSLAVSKSETAAKPAETAVLADGPALSREDQAARPRNADAASGPEIGDHTVAGRKPAVERAPRSTVLSTRRVNGLLSRAPQGEASSPTVSKVCATTFHPATHFSELNLLTGQESRISLSHNIYEHASTRDALLLSHELGQACAARLPSDRG